MTTHLVFETEPLANAAESQISLNMGFVGSITTRWAIPQQRLTDSKWFFIKPDNDFMASVVAYVEEAFSQDWLPPITESAL